MKGKTKVKPTPSEYVMAAGWQLADDDLADVLERDFGVKGFELEGAIELARGIRAEKAEVIVV